MPPDQLLPRFDAEARLRAAVERLHRDDELEPRLGGRRQEVGRERRPRDDRAPGAAVAEHMQVVGHPVGDVERNRDRAGGHDADIGDHPFGTALGQKRDPVAGLDPEGSERGGERGGVGPRRGGRRLPPLAVALRGQQRLVAHLGGAVEEHSGKAGAGIIVHR